MINRPISAPLAYGLNRRRIAEQITGLLLYLRTPNGTGAAAGKYVATAGSASIFAALGSDWYTDVATPKALTAAEILALASTNDYHILFSAAKGLAVYDPYTTAQADIDKAHAFYRVSVYADDVPTSYFNGLDFTGATYTGGPSVVADNNGALVNAGSGKPGVQGARLATTVADGAVLGPDTAAATPPCDAGWVNNGDGTSTFTGPASGNANLYNISNTPPVVGKTYKASYQVISNTFASNLLTIIIGTKTSTQGSLEFSATANNTTAVINAEGLKSLTGSITVGLRSFKEVIPTYYDTALDGVTPILPSVEQKTRTGNTDFTEFIAGATFKKYTRTNPLVMPGYLSEPARTNKCTCRKANPVDTSGLEASTINVTISVVSDPDILSSIYRDQCNTGKVYKAVWTGAAYIEISGAVANVNKHSSSIVAKVSNIIGSAVQFGLGNSTPKTTIVGAEYSKYLQENVTPYDSVTKLVLYKPDGTGECYFILPQLEEGPFATSPICKLADGTDPLTAITRAGTVITYPTAGKIRANNTAIRKLIVPRATGQSGVHVYGTYTDANNYTALLMSPTSLTLRKRVAGVDTDATVSITHGAGVPLDIIGVRSTTYGMQLAARAYSGGAWGAWINGTAVTTAAAKADAVIASTYQLGALNSANQMTGNISLFDTLLLPDGIPDPLKYAKSKWGLPA